MGTLMPISTGGCRKNERFPDLGLCVPGVYGRQSLWNSQEITAEELEKTCSAIAANVKPWELGTQSKCSLEGREGKNLDLELVRGRERVRARELFEFMPSVSGSYSYKMLK